MKQVGMFALLIAGVCAGLALGFGLGSGESVRAVSPPELLSGRFQDDDPYLAALRKSQAENDALRAELDRARLAIEDEQQAREDLVARMTDFHDELSTQLKAGAVVTEDAEARIAELEAQLKDERTFRLNMVEEAIESRGLAPKQPDGTGTFEALLYDEDGTAKVLSPYKFKADAGEYMVMLRAAQFMVDSKRLRSTAELAELIKQNKE